MKDLYRGLSLSGPVDSPELLKAAAKECKEVELREAAEEVLLDADKKEVYDNTYRTLAMIQGVREILQLPQSAGAPTVGDFEYTGPAARKKPEKQSPVREPAAKQKRDPKAKPTHTSAHQPVQQTVTWAPPEDDVLAPKRLAKMAGIVAVVAAVVFTAATFLLARKPLPDTGIVGCYGEHWSKSEVTSEVKFFIPQRGSYFIEFYSKAEGIVVMDVVLRHGEYGLDAVKIAPGKYEVRMSVGNASDWDAGKKRFDPEIAEIPPLPITVSDKPAKLREPG